MTKKLYTFGALRMEFMRLGKNKEAFRNYLNTNYTEQEQVRIREAFLTLGKENEVSAGEVLCEPK